MAHNKIYLQTGTKDLANKVIYNKVIQQGYTTWLYNKVTTKNQNHFFELVEGNPAKERAEEQYHGILQLKRTSDQKSAVTCIKKRKKDRCVFQCEDPAEVLDGLGSGLQTGAGQKWLLLPITTRFGRDHCASLRSYN